MEHQLALWREDQLKIAAQVIKIPDENVQCEGGYKYIKYSTKSDDLILLGGVDVSFSGENDLAVAVYVISKGESIVYQDSIQFQIKVPYISSYLAFREIDPLTELVLQQKDSFPNITPYAILVDGNGIFHERGAGIASFLGVRTNMRTIGVSKSLYCMDDLKHQLVEEGLKMKLDNFLANCRCGLFESITETSDPEVQNGDTGLVIMSEVSISPDNVCGVPTTPYEANIESVSNYCDGFAVPLMGKSGSILAMALVSHGGRICKQASRGRAARKQGGTKIPIYLSIGHNISLLEATKICTNASYAR